MKGYVFWMHVGFALACVAVVGGIAATEWGLLDHRVADGVFRWAVENWKVSLALWVGVEALGFWLDAQRREGEDMTPPGICPDCGYDLRATPDRCPECGRVKARFTHRRR